MGRLQFSLVSLLVLLSGTPLAAQAVISTHSGVVNFLDGTASLDDQKLEQKSGTFPTIKDGSTLRTEDGRAEILLTPGIFLRVDEDSAVRMISDSLSDTRAEFLSGSIIVDAKDAPNTDSVTILYKGYEVRFTERGVFRFNAQPGVLQSYSGVAKVTAQGHPPATVDDAHQFFFDIGLETEKLGDGLADSFSEWARDRSDAIAAENAAVAQNSGDPGDLSAPPMVGPDGSFSLGIPSYGLPTYNSPVAPLAVGSAYPYLSASPLFFNRPLGYPMIGVFTVPRRFGHPTSPGYPLWLQTGRSPYPVPVHPVRPIPWPGRTGRVPIYGLRQGSTGLVSPIGPRPGFTGMRPMPVTPARPAAPAVRPSFSHPTFAHPAGHR